MTSFVKYLLLGLLLAQANVANAEPLRVVTTI